MGAGHRSVPHTARFEGGVQLAERWIIAVLRHEHFTSLGALNVRIGELVATINDRPFKRLEGTRRSMFDEIDRPALQPLPASRYEFATRKRMRKPTTTATKTR